MRKLSKTLVFTFALAAGSSSVAIADTAFGAGSLIIPAGAAYQTDCGAVSMYGLVYDVLRANAWLQANGHGTVEIYYGYNETKDSPNRCTPTNLHNGRSYSAGVAPGPVFPASVTPAGGCAGAASPAPATCAAHDDAKWNDGCDFEVYSTSVTPVRLVNKTNILIANDTDITTVDRAGSTTVYPQWIQRTIVHTAVPATNATTVRYGGGSFVIEATDATTFLNLLNGTISARDSSNNVISFQPFRSAPAPATIGCTYNSTVGGNVNIHRAQVAFTAPTPKIFTEAPPRLALLATDGPDKTGTVSDNILQKYLSNGGLSFAGSQGCPTGGYYAANTTQCPTPSFGTPGQIYDRFDFEDLRSGKLAAVSGGEPVYKMLWAPHWTLKTPSTGPNGDEVTAISNMSTFLDGAAGLMAECASIELLEGVPTARSSSSPSRAASASQFQTCKDNGGGVCDATADLYGFSTNSGGNNSAAGGTACGLLTEGIADGPCASPTGHQRNCTDPNLSAGTTCIHFSYPDDPFSQTAEYRWDGFVYSSGSSVADFKPRAGSIYRPGVLSMVSGVSSLDKTKLAALIANPLDATGRTMINGDFATRNYKDNSSAKSNILYLGDHDQTASVAGTKIVLQTLLQLGAPSVTPVIEEVTRSTPIIAAISGVQSIVQGTFEKSTPPATTTEVDSDDATELAAFQFPDVLGHMRAVSTVNITTSQASFDVPIALFDAADRIPAPDLDGCATYFDGGCRSIFTNTTSGPDPTTVMINNDTTTVAALSSAIEGTSPLADATTTKIVEKILAGRSVSSSWVPKLGGVDRSTVSVVETSIVAGSARPTMIYFGASDGMLHAVCGSEMAGTACASPNGLGREVWAFMPRTQLPRVRTNTTKIDGSPRVVDIFGDFNFPKTGARQFRTILTFQTASGDASSGATTGETPAVYALDITDPEAPVLLWEYTTPNTRTVTELGQGMAILAVGQILNSGVNKLAAIVQTNNGGTGGSGNVIVAIDLEAGTLLWKTGHEFSDRTAGPPTRPAGTPPVSGIPGGAVGVDKFGTGTLSDVLFGTLYGELWLLNAGDGTNRYGTNPLFRFTTNEKPFGSPPALYSTGGGSLFAVAGSGGYVDPSDPNVVLWSSGTQQVVAVSLNTPVTATTPNPLDETLASPPAPPPGSPYVPWTLTLGAGEKVFGQPIVVGGQVFVTTDTADVNAAATGTDTGKAYRMDTVDGGNQASVDIRSGAGGLGVNRVADPGYGVFASSGDKVQRLATDATSIVGNSVNDAAPKVSRRLWLRTL